MLFWMYLGKHVGLQSNIARHKYSLPILRNLQSHSFPRRRGPVNKKSNLTLSVCLSIYCLVCFLSFEIQQILVSNFCIHMMFNKTGEVKGKLLNTNDSTSEPKRIFYCQSTQKMFLSFDRQNTISVYEVKLISKSKLWLYDPPNSLYLGISWVKWSGLGNIFCELHF